MQPGEVVIDQEGEIKLPEEGTTIELVEEGGHLFVSGGEPLNWSVADIVRQDREQRMKQLMGEYYQPPSEDEYGD